MLTTNPLTTGNNVDMLARTGSPRSCLHIGLFCPRNVTIPLCFKKQHFTAAHPSSKKPPALLHADRSRRKVARSIDAAREDLAQRFGTRTRYFIGRGPRAIGKRGGSKCWHAPQKRKDGGLVVVLVARRDAGARASPPQPTLCEDVVPRSRLVRRWPRDPAR